MNELIKQPERSVYHRWVWSTTLGWLTGFVLILLLAMIWDMIGGNAQFMVGIGMGAGVGYFQARLVKTWTGRLQPWFWTTIIGMGFPFLAMDMASMAGLADFLSLPVCVLLGGLLTGLLQHGLLRPKFKRTYWWIPACVAGWGLPAGLIALGDSGLLPSFFNILNLVILLGGGLILGVFTGLILQWMSPKEAFTQNERPAQLADD